MGDSSRFIGSYASFANGTSRIGVNAGASRLSTATGGAFIGYRAGFDSSSGPSSIAIGSDAVIGTLTGNSIAIGYNARVTAESADANSIALGLNALCTTANTIVFGDQVGAYDNIIEEFGAQRQWFYTMTTSSGNLTLSGTTGAMAIRGGFIAFENIAANATLTLPDMADILAVMPTYVEGSTGECIVSNFNSGGYTVTVVANGVDTFWYNSTPIAANTIQHSIYRYVETSPIPPVHPCVEFFS